MTETRITGRLPQLDLEIRTGRDEDAGAEWMTVSLRAVPSFEAAARLFDPWLWWQVALAWNPWLACMQKAAMLPASPTAVLPSQTTTDRGAPAPDR